MVPQGGTRSPVVGKVLVMTESKPKPDTPTWDAYLMGFATHAATKSKDTTQVGAVLVADDGKTVLLSAYNGPPRGVADTPDRFDRPAKYDYASHAEMNAVAHAAAQGIRTYGCTIYVTHAPCSICSRLIIQAGIKRVVYGDGETSMPAVMFEAARVMLAEAGVSLATHPTPQGIAAGPAVTPDQA